MDHNDNIEEVNNVDGSKIHLPCNVLVCDKINHDNMLNNSSRKARSEVLSIPKHIVVQTANVRTAAANLIKVKLEWNQDSIPTNFLIVHREHDQDLIFPFVLGISKWLLHHTFGRNENGSKPVVWVSHLLRPFLQDYLDLEGEDEKRKLTKFIENGNLNFWDDCTFQRQADISKDGKLNTDPIGSNFYDHEEKDNEDIDLIITLGGDGTVLKAAWLFQTIVPVILPFHLGTFGFLTVFDFDQHERILEQIFRDGTRVNVRMRLECSINRSDQIVHQCHVLNELVIERGPSPFMTALEMYGDGCFLTTVHADGLIVATPTGSTAYSLSAGGPLVHPDSPAILVTPICPHTLSFRPFMLPETMKIEIRLASSSRASAWVSFDGRSRHELLSEDRVIIRSSSFPVPTICKQDQTTDWFQSLSRCLFWNERPRKQSLSQARHT